MQSTRRLNVEQLEERCLLSFGSPWPEASQLTLSFAPDGTTAGNRTSDLFSTLNAVAPTATWQHEILRAFQTWAVQSNINIGVVPDGGQPFGTPGAPQGDPRFGDIRIGAYATGTNGEMAVASPYDYLGGTWSGDVKLNTSYQFSIGGGNNTIDLYTAMLHEAAHSLGLDHSTNSSSAVYADYLGPRTGLGGDDVSRIQALYGARTPDQYEGSTGNGTFSSATPLTLLSNPDGSLGIAVNADVTTLSDADVYKFQAPLNVGSMKVNLNVAGMSLLDAKVTVYNSWGQVVGSAVATDPLHNNLSISVSSPMPLGTYYVKVQSGSNDVFGIGSYQLQIQSIPLVKTTTSLLSGLTTTLVQTANNTLPLNNSFLTAALLPPITSQTNSRFDYAFTGSLNSGTEQDYYLIKAPQPPAGQPNVMTVMVWGTDSKQLQPRVSVYDAKENLVAANVIVNEGGSFTVQVPNAVAGATYYVKVAAANPSGTNNTGGYFLGIDFSTTPVSLQTVTQGTLSATQSESAGTLTLSQAQLMHFVLSAQAASPSTAAAIRLTVLNSSGAVVATTVAYNGSDAVSVTPALAAGSYTVLLTEYAPSGSSLPSVQYTLQAARLDDPIGPQPDSSTAPSGSTTTSSGTTTTTSSSSTTTTSSGSTTTSTDPTMTSPPPSSTSTSTTSGTDTSANSGSTTTSSSSTTTSSSSTTTSSGTTSTSPTSSSSSYYYYQSGSTSTTTQDPSSDPYTTS